MIKKSQFATAWPTIYNMIREMGLMKELPPMNKIKLDTALPQQAGALGFVTTEDSDDNGTLDTMHIVVPNIDRHLQGINAAELQRLKIEDPNRLKQILMPIVELIAHEQGHQKDYRHGEDNPFPGGEHVADQAAQQALSQISTQATNNTNKNDIKRGFVMNKEIISRLVKLAGDLDEKKAFDLSDEVTGLAEKFAQEMPMSGRRFQFSDWMASDVPFTWGRWKGARPGEAYYVASDRGSGELGPVQFPGDPFTYEPAGEGKLRVVSGPERGRNALLRVIEDPRTKSAPSQQPASAPQRTGREPDDLLRLDRPEAQLQRLDGQIKLEFEKMQKMNQFITQKLNRMGFEGKAVAAHYERGINPDQKLQVLERELPFLKERGYDVSELEQAKERLRRIADSWSKMVMERKKLRGNQADDGAEKEVEASLKADELTKNASLNAIFWKANTKTPFGR